jgi:predicted metal-binding membrane protein
MDAVLPGWIKVGPFGPVDQVDYFLVVLPFQHMIHEIQVSGFLTEYAQAGKQKYKGETIFHTVIFFINTLAVWNLHGIIMSLLCKFLDGGFIRTK